MENKVAQILSQLLGIKINPGDDVSADTVENWDSMKHIEIIMTLEEEFNVSIAPEDIAQLKSVTKIVKKLKELNAK